MTTASGHKLVVALGGASGAWYAKLLFDRLLELSDQWERIGVTYSENALTNWQLEIGEEDFRTRYPLTSTTNRISMRHLQAARRGTLP